MRQAGSGLTRVSPTEELQLARRRCKLRKCKALRQTVDNGPWMSVSDEVAAGEGVIVRRRPVERRSSGSSPAAPVGGSGR